MKLINTSFNELIKDKKLTFLVGAGCSVNPPSSLPTGKEMMNDIIEFSCSENFKEDLKKLKILRFEQLVEIFIELIDKNLYCIDFFSECKSPNSIHLFLAHMIKRGHFAITTNFDSLIEHAMIKLGIPKDLILPVITKNEFLKYSNPNDIFNGGKFSVYKIHGSPIDIIKNTSKPELRESLIVTIRSFVQDKKGLNLFELEPYKQEAVENLLKNRTLVVMGYSGSDDFDIMPTLESVKGINEIIWISHDDTHDLKIWELEGLNNDDSYPQEVDKILSRLKNLNRNIRIIKVIGMVKTLISEVEHFKANNVSELFELKPIQWLQIKLNTPPEIVKIQMCYLILIKFSFFRKALECVDKILKIAIKENDLYWQSVAYNNRGSIMEIQGNFKESLTNSNKAYDVIKKTPPLSRHLVTVQLNRGKAFHSLGLINKALEIAEEALKVAKELNDKVLIAIISNGLGLINRELGINDLAETYFRSALSLFEKNNDPIGKSVVLLNLALNYRNRGDYEQEQNYLQIATQISEKLNSRIYLSACYTEWGHSYSNINDWEKAQIFYNKTLDLAIDMGDKKRWADILRSMGNLLSRQGRLNDALEKYKESYQIYIGIGSRQGEAVNLEDMGYIFERNGDLSKAIKYYKKALEINQEIGNYKKILNNQNSLGLAYHKMEKFGEALKNYVICLAMIKNIEDPLVLCNFYLNYSSLLVDLSKDDEASEYLKLAKEICLKFSIKSNLPHLNAIYGKLREKNGNDKKAIFYYKKALEKAEELNYKRDEACYLNKLGVLYKKIGNFDKALDHYEKALSIANILNDHYGEVNILYNIGFIYSKKSDFNQALKKFLEAKHLIKEHNINDIEFNNRIENAITIVSKNIKWKKS